MNRRDFLKQASASTVLLSSSRLAASAQGSPNDRIAIGCIGAGDRASALMKEIQALAQQQNVRIAAICDVWRKNLQTAAANVKKQSGQEPKQFTRFGELLALPGIDAVVIATPDFSHGPILVAALEAGKDVYIEKPMTIDVASANKALDLARAKNRVVQAGTQRRSDGLHLGASKVVASGVLGQISRVSATVNFNHARWARRYDDCLESEVDWDAFLLHYAKRPFDPKLLRRWQMHRFTSNGLAGLWMTHYADAVHLVTGAKYPSSAVAHGGIYIWKDGREHTDTFHALLDYPEGFLFDWGMGLGNAAGINFTVHGTKGTLDIEKWTVMPEVVAGGRAGQTQVSKVQPERTAGHMENWLACLRSRQRPNADIQFGHQHAIATIMAATALETGQRQKWDPIKREIREG
ncbi:MAG: Gfo/Idh/MocA family oxidoreductase [Verrucomicrobia bacterium]|nr:Gfo/Idh/MocA family oxidoreductase [Verrucomicrobiota bacterium]